MIRKAFLAGLLALSASASALAAGDPAAVAAVEPFLRDDEKAMLAAVLSNPAAAADFNADVKLAAGDPKVMKLVLDKWRGRIVSYAEADSRIGTPDLEGSYKNSSSMMTPATRAYLVRRLKTMKEADRNSLIEYLDAVDSALASNGGKLTWYTKKVVSGIFDKYRQDLGLYLPEPIARNGKAAAPAAAAALAERRKAAEQPAPVVVVKEPAVKDPVAAKKPPVGKKPAADDKKPVADGKKPAAKDPNADALEQARRAAEAAERGGAVFDGGGAKPPSDGGVVAGAPGAGRPPLAPSPRPGGKPNLTADVPSPVDPDEDFMSSVKKMKTGPGPLSARHYLPGAAGAVLGALIGFLLGGPVGAVIGAGAGLIAGDIAGGRLFK
ncbi:MAG: hypothetical protein PHS14_11155 [Elusimicrobia bacterium]|nr:hypothetical protein [Elusimicrobiota bacterium]